jgi:hypothetical protein
MAKVELDLLQFTSIYMAKLCTGPKKIMRRRKFESKTGKEIRAIGVERATANVDPDEDEDRSLR